MAQPYYPSYSTNTGDAFGYSERAGSDNGVLRSQYAGTYRGEPSFEPARYSAASPYRGSQQLEPLEQPPMPQYGSAPPSSRKTQYRAPTPIAAGAPTPYTGIYTAPLDLSRRDRAKTGNAPAIYPRESKQHPPITSLAPKQLWEAEELVDHGAASVYGLGTTRQLTSAVQAAATRDLSASAGRQRRPKTPPLVRPGPTYEKELSARNCGKLSVSRRLPEGERLRYHIPGYMGFVKGSQFHHGGTYGKTTRKCIEDHHPAAVE